jgi:endonuclease/exonuclease/phosphatase family metal-dependent hydrolase
VSRDHTAPNAGPNAAPNGGRRRLTGLTALNALAIALAGELVPTAASARRDTAPIAPDPATGFRMIQANLESPQSGAHFQADFAAVIAQQPDFVTLNEVAYRYDVNLMPPGYAMWRPGRAMWTPETWEKQGRYAAENAVLWRTDRWTMTDQGSTRILNKQGVPRGKRVELGKRYANWVTLVSADGRTVSVVSTHFTPYIKEWGDLAPREVRNLGELTATLATRGPVLIGGDFNFHYRSQQYPATTLAENNIVPTYDLFGGAFPPTGDHFGATVDYQFVVQNGDQVRPVVQWTTELNSDHDALGTDWQYGALAPEPTTLPSTNARFAPRRFANHPKWRHKGQRSVVRRLNKAINNAPPGSAIHLATGNLADGPTRRALLWAQKRGVYVQVLIRDERMNRHERALRKHLGRDTRMRTWFADCESHKCQRVSKRMARTTLLVSQSGQTPAVKITVNRSLGRWAVKRKTRARQTTDLPTYNRGFHKYFLLIE